MANGRSKVSRGAKSPKSMESAAPRYGAENRRDRHTDASVLAAERLLTRVGQHMWRDYQRRLRVGGITVGELVTDYEAVEIVWELKRDIRRELRK